MGLAGQRPVKGPLEQLGTVSWRLQAEGALG